MTHNMHPVNVMSYITTVPDMLYAVLCMRHILAPNT